MKYQKTEIDEKKCLLSVILKPTQKFIEKLESYNFRGGPSHIQTNVEKFSVVVYAPDKFLPGVETLLRVLVKRVDDRKYYKLVFVPDSEKLDEGLTLTTTTIIDQLVKLQGGCDDARQEWMSLFAEKEPGS